MTRFGRWVEAQVPVDETRLAGRFEKVDGEPLWTQEDRDIALVYTHEENQRCPQCGTAEWEWDENSDAWHADNWTCEGCRRRDKKRRELSEGYRSMNHMAGLDGQQIRMFRTAREEN